MSLKDKILKSDDQERIKIIDDGSSIHAYIDDVEVCRIFYGMTNFISKPLWIEAISRALDMAKEKRI